MNIHSMVSKVYNLANELRHEHNKAVTVKAELTKKRKEAEKLLDVYDLEMNKFWNLIETSPEWTNLSELLEDITNEQWEVVNELEGKEESAQDAIWDIEAAFENAEAELDINITID